jgi:hypothetical protein
VSDTVYNAERDLREAKAMAEGLVPYVYEDILYGRTRGGLFGSGNMPALTGGALLMRLRRLRTLEDILSPAQRDQLNQIERQHESIRSEWQQHYIEKLHREGESRLKAMNTFFDECGEDPRQCANIYLPEVLRRTTVQEIVRALDELSEPHEELTKAMHYVDNRLHKFTQPDGFIWADDLATAYPADEFWWMYAKPPRVERETQN